MNSLKQKLNLLLTGSQDEMMTLTKMLTYLYELFCIVFARD